MSQFIFIQMGFGFCCIICKKQSSHNACSVQGALEGDFREIQTMLYSIIHAYYLLNSLAYILSIYLNFVDKDECDFYTCRSTSTLN